MKALLATQELHEFIQSEVGPSASGTGADALNSTLGVYDKIGSDDAVQYLANCFLFVLFACYLFLSLGAS